MSVHCRGKLLNFYNSLLRLSDHSLPTWIELLMNNNILNNVCYKYDVDNMFTFLCVRVCVPGPFELF